MHQNRRCLYFGESLNLPVLHDLPFGTRTMTHYSLGNKRIHFFVVEKKFFWYVSCCEHRLKSKTALITKRWRKKGSQLLPEDDARGWAGRLGVHSKNQLHLLRVGWLAMESVHLTCPCCSEGVVLRYVSGYWLNLSLKIANISQIRVEIQGPQLQELRHVSFFWVNGPKKRLQRIPQENAGTEWTC